VYVTHHKMVKLVTRFIHIRSLCCEHSQPIQCIWLLW